MFRYLKNKSVFIQVVIFWLIVIILVALANYFVYKSVKLKYLDDTEEIAKHISEHIEDELTQNFRNLRNIAKEIDEEDLKDYSKIVSELNFRIETSRYRKIAIAYLDGKSYATNGEMYDVSQRDYFQRAKKGEEVISNVIYSLDDETQVNVYAVPVYDKFGKVVAVVWASLDTESFSKSLNVKSNDVDVYLMDNFGNLIAGNSAEDNFFEVVEIYDINKKSIENLKKDIDEKKGNYQYFEYKGKKVYMYYKEVMKRIHNESENWWILVRVNKDIVFEATRNITRPLNQISAILIFIFTICFAKIFNKYNQINKSLRDIAYTDSITKGHNEYYLENYLQKNGKKFKYRAFISLQIENISAITNVNGLKGVEYILLEIYNYLQEYLGEDVVIAHSHFGDFKFILEAEKREDVFQKLDGIYIEKIDRSIPIEYYIGIYFMKEEKESFKDLCTYVNLAKHNCNKDNICCVYNEKMHNQELEIIALKDDIKRGILNKEFKAWLQPKYDSKGEKVVGAEALVRWHKYGSIISPYIFIPICEEQGYIQDIDELVLIDVCKQLRKWIDQGKEVVPISVNLSRNYLDKEDAISRLIEIINEYKIEFKYIQFEVTESSLVGNEEKLKEILEKLSKKGFKILLDDFGVGYSSLKTMADLKFDILKIDKSFVDQIGTEKGNNIIKYTVQLCKQLEMGVVVEGVEQKEQFDFLAQLECEYYQGYYFGKPMPTKDFEKLL